MVAYKIQTESAQKGFYIFWTSGLLPVVIIFSIFQTRIVREVLGYSDSSSKADIDEKCPEELKLISSSSTKSSWYSNLTNQSSFKA